MVVVCVYKQQQFHTCRLFFNIFAQVLRDHSANTEKGKLWSTCTETAYSMAAVGTWSFSLPAVEKMRCMILAGQSSTDVVENAIAGK